MLWGHNSAFQLVVDSLIEVSKDHVVDFCLGIDVV